MPHKIIRWNWPRLLSRTLAILFTAFLALFALDVFDGNSGFWMTLLALFMHLIPNFVLIILIWIGWKRPIVPGIIFILAGLAYTIQVARVGYPFWAVPIAMPAFIIGGLYIADHVQRRKKRK